MGPLCDLGLQLLTKGIIALSVTDMTKLGTTKLRSYNLAVTLPSGLDAEGNRMHAYM